MNTIKIKKNTSVVRKKLIKSKKITSAKKKCKKIGRKCGNNKTKIKKKKKNKTLKMKGGDDDLPECSICFDTILPSQAIFSCANEHIFHINCARNYCLFRQMRNLGYTFECPLCRDITRTCPPAQNPNGTFTTYGDWLDDHSTDDSVYDYGEDGYDDITRGRLNTMIINETFSRRRLHIHNYRLHLFDGETHRYLGTTYYHSPSIIINYIYENVYTPIYENN